MSKTHPNGVDNHLYRSIFEHKITTTYLPMKMFEIFIQNMADNAEKSMEPR